VTAALAASTVAAFYGLSGQPSAPAHPVQTATPGTSCNPGTIGAFGDHVYECVNGKWT
jgi:hypothetical protein